MASVAAKKGAKPSAARTAKATPSPTGVPSLVWTGPYTAELGEQIWPAGSEIHDEVHAFFSVLNDALSDEEKQRRLLPMTERLLASSVLTPLERQRVERVANRARREDVDREAATRIVELVSTAVKMHRSGAHANIDACAQSVVMMLLRTFPADARVLARPHGKRLVAVISAKLRRDSKANDLLAQLIADIYGIHMSPSALASTARRKKTTR